MNTAFAHIQILDLKALELIGEGIGLNRAGVILGCHCQKVRYRLDRLEKAFGGELVTRPGAGRDSRTTLTDMGKKVLSQVTPILAQWDEALLEWGEV
ncbi:hypothetical protein [uncultured Marinobacter sp.]|uniref:hypothetical protein n=1 Tax=uncultured Marinobacter sp. TaxID=187379 RepID=UPI0030D6DC12